MSVDLFERYYQSALNDIYIIDESYSCLFFVSDHVQIINRGSVGHLFGRMQTYFQEAMILSAGKLFDATRDVFSIPAMIAKSSEFPLQNKEGFLAALPKLGASKEIIALVEKEGLSARAVQGLILIGPQKDKIPELRRVIDARHKEVAHRDSSAKKFSRPTFADIKFCNELAKDWLTCFALGVRNISLRSNNGQFYVSEDALGTSREIKRILQLIRVLPPDHGCPQWMIERIITNNSKRLDNSQGDR